MKNNKSKNETKSQVLKKYIFIALILIIGVTQLFANQTPTPFMDGAIQNPKSKIQNEHSELFFISGKVEGLTNNEGITVKYTIDGGIQKFTLTTNEGKYKIEDIQYGSNVIIVASAQEGYISSVSQFPSTSMVDSDITDKNIIYTENASIQVIHAQVINCFQDSEIDIFPMIGYDYSDSDLTFSVIDQPKYAENITDLNINNKLPYRLHTIFQGKDNLKFSVECNITGNIDTIKLYVSSLPCPDNVSDAKCFGEPTATAWGINENFLKSDVLVNTYGQPYVGDVDGCGKNEVVIWNFGGGGTGATAFGSSTAILIFDDELNLKYTIPTEKSGTNSNSPPDLALAFAKTDPNNTAADIFVTTGTAAGISSLRCFTFNGTNWTQKWAKVAGTMYSAVINIGDINNDGNIMLYTDYKIFNAKTGALLLTLPSSIKGKREGSAAIINLLADMDNNGTLEAVAGTHVYKLNITNLNNETGNNYEILYELSLSEFPDIQNDGYVSVADINLDGYLDIILSTTSTNTPTRPRVLVWNTQTDPPSLIGNPIIVGDYADNNISRAFVGDVDNDGYPELVVATEHRITCLKLNEDKTNFVQKWKKTIVDKSGMTYMCMFDFNQDNKQEIVYRDEQRLRIIDGETGVFMAEIPCYSPTIWEGPIVADLNGDGHAQIIVTGNDISGSTYDQTRLRVYTSSEPGAWAYARQVWNQYSYNALNINEDLSVPRYQMNPSTIFQNGKRPFNGFLKQQTLLNRYGNYLWTLPNLQWQNELEFVYTGDSLIISGTVKNIGERGMMPPIYVTIYKNIAETGNILKLDSINTSINAGDILNVDFIIENISNHSDILGIVIGLNEKEGEESCQTVCVASSRKELAFNPLPITLLWFKGKCKEENIEVNWRTLSEKDNEFFTVEYSEDMVNFMPLLKIAGAGNSTTPIDYLESVLNPSTAKILYLRLKQTDYDGKNTTSHAIALNNCTNKSITDLHIYPNPANNTLNIESKSTIERIEIYDLTNRIVKSSPLYNDYSIELDIQTLLPGVYILKTYTSNNEYINKFVKNIN